MVENVKKGEKKNKNKSKSKEKEKKEVKKEEEKKVETVIPMEEAKNEEANVTERFGYIERHEFKRNEESQRAYESNYEAEEKDWNRAWKILKNTITITMPCIFGEEGTFHYVSLHLNYSHNYLIISLRKH